MSIKTKMASGFALILLVYAISSGFVFFQFANVQSDVNDLALNRVPSMEMISQMDNDMLNYSRYFYAFTLAGTAAEMDQAETKMNTLSGEFNQHRQVYEALISGKEERSIYEQFMAKWTKYLKDIQQVKQEWRNHDPAVQQHIVAARTLFNDADGLMEQLVELNVKGAKVSGMNSTSTVSMARMILVVSIIISIVLGAVIGTLITLSIIRPLKLLDHNLQMLVEKGGDLTHKIEIHSKDEVQHLAGVVNAFLENLRSIISQVLHSSQQLAAASEELNSSAEQSAQAAEQVAHSIVAVAQGAEKQSKASGETASVVEQMSAGIEQAASSASHVAGVADKASQAAKDGNGAIERVVAQMGYIKKSVDQVNDSVGKLSGRSREIGEILDVISGIAAQTNLLALNAAIEAARAGEAGRGFAVVADEVRKLAEQSRQSTEEISSLIGLIRKDTEQAAAAMDSGVKEVTVGHDVVAEAGQSFDHILGLVTELSNEVSDISATMEEMASGSQTIVESVHVIENVSKETASQSETVSAATEEQSASMGEIASASQNLARLALELEDAIKKFKV